MTDSKELSKTSPRLTFPGISPQAFQHPLDRTALDAVQRVRGMDWIVRKFLMAIGERRLRLLFLASAVRVSDDQLPAIKKLYDEACATLDVQDPPELYVSQTATVNAAAIGVDRPFIMVTSSIVGMLSEDELRCVLGHELGHVMCGHALYTTVLMLLVRMWHLFVGIPGGLLALVPIRMALMEWSRKAELTADRAGLVVSQDPEVSMRVDMKLAGGKRADEMSVDAFIRQAEEYKAGGDLLDGVLKLVLLMDSTHPFPVLRVVEIKKWAESEEFQKLLDGRYARRGEEPESPWLDQVKATASEYKESFDSSTDPFLSALRDVGSHAASAGQSIYDFVRKTAGISTPPDPPPESPPDDSAH